jgi:hypothetical protein
MRQAGLDVTENGDTVTKRLTQSANFCGRNTSLFTDKLSFADFINQKD